MTGGVVSAATAGVWLVFSAELDPLPQALRQIAVIAIRVRRLMGIYAARATKLTNTLMALRESHQHFAGNWAKAPMGGLTVAPLATFSDQAYTDAHR